MGRSAALKGNDMINIEAGEQTDNARGMLDTKHAKFLGWIGDIRYFACDGKAWSISGGTIARSDCADESAQIFRQVKALNS